MSEQVHTRFRFKAHRPDLSEITLPVADWFDNTEVAEVEMFSAGDRWPPDPSEVLSVVVDWGLTAC